MGAVKRDAMIAARLWVTDNPVVYAWILRWVHEDIAANKRVSTKRYIEWLRDSNYIPWASGPYKIDNSFSGPFNRIIAADYPDLAPHLKMRASKYDAPAPYKEVDLDGQRQFAIAL